jgi:phosphoadenosine phosphosulfate reductase
MALIENTLFGRVDKVAIAIQRIQAFAPPNGEPYYLGYSGGKDSDTILRLTQMAGVPYEAHYNLTTVDPPEVVYHVRNHKEVIIDSPEITMWRLIVKMRMPPTRRIRYCCEVLKEGYGAGRLCLLGVRREESNARKASHALVTVYSKKKSHRVRHWNDNNETVRMVHSCYEKQRHSINPIFDWSDEDVWEFLQVEKVRYCELYDEGFSRLGCIGCPMADRQRIQQFKRWPKYYDNYLRAFGRMVEARKRNGLTTRNFHDAQSVMDWWLDDRNMDKPIPGQEEFDIDSINDAPDKKGESNV